MKKMYTVVKRINGNWMLRICRGERIILVVFGGCQFDDIISTCIKVDAKFNEEDGERDV